MNSEEKYKVFCKYFDELDRQGIPFGLSDLIRRAKELDLAPEILKELKGVTRYCQ